MRALVLIMLAALIPVRQAYSAADPFAGWSPEKLKQKLAEVMQENASLKRQLGGGQSAVAAAAPAGAMVVDDFEGKASKVGTQWYVGCDQNKLGTKINPSPFKIADGGSPASPGHSAHIFGHLGKFVAPWPWATLGLDLKYPAATTDLSGYSSVRFYCKGDGGVYKMRLARQAVKDGADYFATFTADPTWKPVTIPFDSFAQPMDWGKRVPRGFQDILGVKFEPTVGDSNFDLSLDDLTFLK